MAAVGVLEEERRARERLRQQQRMRRGRERQLERERKAQARAAERRRAWGAREKAAYEAHVQDPGNVRLTQRWLACWHEPEAA